MSEGIDDKTANIIIKKVQRIMELNNSINEANKKLKPLKEEKTLLMDELTELFVNNNIETYEADNYNLKLVQKQIKDPLNEDLIRKSITEEIVKENNFDKLKTLLINSINEQRNTGDEINTIKIGKKKVKKIITKKDKKEKK